ncbi:MAG TPA: shikimate dehydrogenase [Burkholderiaceae bacterium]|nr:shikimate dehydrogenase [Burkholderiaceae bacterium]
MIHGKTSLIAHLGYPTEAFKAPMIYNPWFAQRGIDAVVVPMGIRAPDYPLLLQGLACLTNLTGALVTMPHKVSTLALVAQATPQARIAGACNALKLLPDGSWLGAQFDGDGFVRGVLRKGRTVAGAAVFISGCGGVGSAIAASFAAAGVGRLGLYDVHGAAADALRERLLQHHPALDVRVGSPDPAGHAIVVNATPLGMRAGDPLPLDIERVARDALVGEVVMSSEHTPLLQAALARGCAVQVGTDMLFEMIPAYLEFFGFGTATPDELRAAAQIRY